MKKFHNYDLIILKGRGNSTSAYHFLLIRSSSSFLLHSRNHIAANCFQEFLSTSSFHCHAWRKFLQIGMKDVVITFQNQFSSGRHVCRKCSAFIEKKKSHFPMKIWKFCRLEKMSRCSRFVFEFFNNCH